MFDFLSVTEDTDRYNFHSHTQFCDGHASMEDMAAAAAGAGMLHYGFSPHSPIPIPSPCNMSRDKVDEYLAEARRLRSLYEGRMNVYTSMEIDYLGPEWGPAHPYFDTLPLDYRIGSVHFIPAQDGTLVDVDGRFESFKRKMAEHFHNDIRYVVETFYRQTREMIRAGRFDVIGHFDKIGHNASHYCEGIEETGWYRELVEEVIGMIVDAGLTVEINTKAWADHRRVFPAPRYLLRLLREGVTIIVNSDAHYPALVDASRSHGLDFLRSASHHH